ncbi:hypothetical protein Z947_2856 [Sulfitobacter geojensis]|nr:hypothetical protein Z947_2856 [Sulfitobacter geojensis]
MVSSRLGTCFCAVTVGAAQFEGGNVVLPDPAIEPTSNG